MKKIFNRTHKNVDRRIDLWSRLAGRVENDSRAESTDPGGLAELRQIRSALEREAEPDPELQASLRRALALQPRATPGALEGSGMRHYLPRVAAGLLLVPVCGVSLWLGDLLLFDLSVLAFGI